MTHVTHQKFRSFACHRQHPHSALGVGIRFGAADQIRCIVLGLMSVVQSRTVILVSDHALREPLIYIVLLKHTSMRVGM